MKRVRPMNEIERVIAVAKSEVGYLEKKSNKDLDDKTANAGNGNFTKYARDLDNVAGFYNGKKNGYAWCDIFVDWCFYKAFGVTRALELLCQPQKSCGAGVGFSVKYYKDKGQYYTSNPKVGDQVFFSKLAHTGLVVKIDDKYVYTIEGNTSGPINCVKEKKYSLNSTSIVGYGRPNYSENMITPPDEEKMSDVPKLSKKGYIGNGDKGEEVKKLQLLLNYFNGSKLNIDGSCGPLTVAEIKMFQKNNNLQVDGYFGPKSLAKVKKILGIATLYLGTFPSLPNKGYFSRGNTGIQVKYLQQLLNWLNDANLNIDGSCGPLTVSEIKKFQKNNGLTVDGYFGPKSLAKAKTIIK